MTANSHFRNCEIYCQRSTFINYMDYIAVAVQLVQSAVVIVRMLLQIYK
jgi:hypothetical protein